MHQQAAATPDVPGQRLRPLRRPVVLLGAATVALVWAGAALLLDGASRPPVFAVATLATLLILGGVALALRHRLRLERAHAASEAHAREAARDLEVTLDNMSQGIMMVDGARNLSVINRKAAQLLDLPEHFLVGRWRFDDLLAHQWAAGEFGPDGAALEPQLRDFIVAGGMPGDAPGRVNVYERTRPNGTVLEVRSVVLADGGMVRTFTDITERRRNEQRLVHLARRDTLTDLANRAVLREDLGKAAARLRRHGERFAVFCLDLDKFKPVNDTLGHAAGDLLLQAVARRLGEVTRETDTVARVGGDEFAILQSVVARQEDVASLATRLLDALKAPYEIDGKSVTIGTSIGIALAPNDGTEPDELMRNADLALYRAKAAGRNCFRLFEPAMDAEVRARRTLEYDLQRAIERDELQLAYQPIVSLATREIFAVEALLRWSHPKYAHMSAAELMRAAEGIRMMVRLGEWLLNKACRDAAAWPGHAKVAVNLAPAQFKDRNLVDLVTEALAESGLPPQRLEIEVTETVLLEEHLHNLAMLHQLRNLGVTMTLDDFGTGYGSLSYLRTFPFDRIKIDGAFVSELLLRPDCAAIVGAVSDLGQRLGTSTVAQGVDNPRQLEALCALGCTDGQGRLFGAPQPAHEIARLLTPPLAATSAA
ncbi:MAG: diguanylate cyclase [Bradyrhizobiaceae bacterium]|nr:MAG: diguanylate cyclase [Bradyrhizobiaceae bacterium]